MLDITGAVHAIVGIRVLNKTLDEYWFLMKVNLSYMVGEVNQGKIGNVTDYFLVRLEIVSR